MLLVVLQFRNLSRQYDSRCDGLHSRFRKVPDDFNGYKIVQLSDLHDAQFDIGHADVVKK